MKNEFGIRCRQTPFLYKIQLRETGNAVGKDLPDGSRRFADLLATLRICSPACCNKKKKAAAFPKTTAYI